MSPQEKFRQFADRYPHSRRPFYARPHFTRRELFRILGASVTATCMIGKPAPAGVVIDSKPVTTQNKAKNVIFILMAGAPSHIDTFDFKQVDGVTPADFKPANINGVVWPTGIMPKLAGQLSKIAIVRSVQAWATGHSVSQTWVQIGRNPSGALGDIAPNIGSVVAIEKYSERLPSQVLPTFIALNSGSGIGGGYLPATYGPMQLSPSPAGIPDTSNVDGEARVNGRFQLLHQLDDPLRINSPYGKALDDFADFDTSARSLMYNHAVSNAFNYSTADSSRYGSTSFGNACLLAGKILGANLGTRYVQITVGGWDMHTNIYGTNGRGGLYMLAKTFDDGVSAMLTDLQSSGQLDQTLVVMMGEFGRTVGKLTATAGRDHLQQQFVAFAGAGISGGRVIGSTTPDGSATDDPGWSRARNVKPEDIEATIYSAMGINWTNVRYDDPFGRGFEYVPFANSEDLYGPINELWAPPPSS
jgi:Protein of unknown function (DUF1501)